jgi:hypothetical protein
MAGDIPPLQLLQLEQAISQPQVGAAAHPLSQQPLFFFLNSLPNRPPQLFLLPHPLSQEAISHPHVGAAPQPQGSQAATSQPQVGSAQQPVSQPLSQPLPHPNKLIFLSCSLLKNSSRGLRRGLLHPVSQPQGSQETTSQPQDGAQASAHDISHPQVGPQGSAQPISHPHEGSHASAHPVSQDEISQPQVGSATHPVSQQALSQPEPFNPSM